MKNVINIIIISICLVACSDFLDVEPDLQTSFNEQLSTQQGVVEAVSGIYRDTEALASSLFYMYADYMGGNIAFAPQVTSKSVVVPSLVEFSYPFQELPTASDYTSYYDNSYRVINQINIILSRINDFSFFNDSQLSQLQAELLTIRAFTHYNLTLLYSQNYAYTGNGSHIGIVYNTDIVDVGVDFPARQSVAQNYESITFDLDQALSLYTNESFLQVGNTYSYFNPTNTQALYARIALQMNDWATAASLSDQLINQSGISLTTNANYLNQWSQSNALDEVILELKAPVNSDGNTSSSISQYFLYNSDTNYGSFTASLDLIDLFEPGDIRSQLYTIQSLDTQTSNGIVSADYYFVNKFDRDSNTMQIRLSELYLIYAEAQQRLTPGNSLALERLNDVRVRAGLPALTATNDMLQQVFDERRRELAFENSLLFDIARFQKNIVRDQGCISNLCNLNYPSGRYILPIPQSSIINNQNMIQNEGY